MQAMPAAPAFRRLVLGSSEAAAAATAAADRASPPSDRVDEIAGAWRACQPELERRRDALAWEDVTPGQPSLAAGLAALPDLERGAVVAQALGLEPREVEQALSTGPGAARGLLARAHASVADLGRPAGAECAEERERLASAPAGTGTEHCADCRAFAAAVSEQRLALRRAAGAEGAASSEERDGKPRVGAAAAAVARVRSAATRPGAASSIVARLRSAASAAAVTAEPILEPKERGPRIAVALAVLLLAGLAGFGVVSALETPREGGGDPGVVTATPVGPLPPGVGPTKP